MGVVVVVEAWGVGERAVLAEDAHCPIRFEGGGKNPEGGFCSRDGYGFTFVGGEDVGGGLAEGKESSWDGGFGWFGRR